MDTLLIDAWMTGTDPLPTIDGASVSLAREAVRALGAELGLDQTVIERAAVAASELVQNQLVHARRGQFALRSAPRGSVAGLEIVAADQGPGIADPALALAGMGPSARSLGAGVSAVWRMMDEMDVDVRWGEGSCIRARVFAEPAPRRREIGVLGRPFAEESVSGDHAAFVREEGVLVAAVVDGIGHGPLARDAAARAIHTFLEQCRSSPAAVLKACDAALQGTRGAVMAIARIDEEAATMEHASTGNINTRLERFRAARRFAGSASTLGARGPGRQAAVETTALDRDEVLVMFTDGLVTRAAISEDPDLFREHPIVIAQRLLLSFGRSHDDALVLVAR